MQCVAAQRIHLLPVLRGAVECYDRAPTDRSRVGGSLSIVQLLARGGMGAVYLAEDLRLDRAQVAVKEMATSFVRGDTEALRQAVAEFEREAAMLARLRHPHLPRVSDRFVEEGKHYLVMEYIRGQTLRETLHQAGGRLPLPQALAYTDQLCEVLGYLHSQHPPIIYRDLKPSNVMVVPVEDQRGWNRRDEKAHAPASSPHPPSTSLVLIDFGIARFYRQDRAGDTAIYGTAGYAPPEQYGQGQTDARTDVYALGVVLHEMLTGHNPATTPFALPPPRALDPSIPPGVAAAIERATTIERTRQFDDIAALRMALQPAEYTVLDRSIARLPDEGLRQPAAHPAPPVRGPRAARLLPATILIALVLVALGAVLWQFGAASGRRENSPTTAPTAQVEPTRDPERKPTADPAAQTPSAVPAINSGGDGTTAQAPSVDAPVVLLRPAQVGASSTAPPALDAQSNEVTYEPANAVDGSPGTAWRVSGDGVNEWLQLDFPSEVRVQAVGIIPGYDKIDPLDGADRFVQNRTLRLARLEFSDGSSVRVSFARQRDMQFVPLKGVRTRWIRIVIEATYPAPPADQGGRDFTPISEVQVQGTP